MTKAETEKRIENVIHAFSGHISFYAEHMQTHETLIHDSDHVMETASVIKLPIMAATFQYLVDEHKSLADPLTLQVEDVVDGSGILQYLSPGLSLSLKDVMTLMIIVSDNTATNMILRYVGIPHVNRFIQSLGLSQTRLLKRIDFTIPGPIGLATAKELGTILTQLYHRTLVNKDASEIMWDILCRQQYNTIMTRHLPYEWITEDGNNPPRVQIGSKSGSLEGIRNDVGIVVTPWGDYVLAILSERSRDLRFHIDNEALVVLPRISRFIFDYFTQTQSF
ncbi:serine hydrolase [Sulfobacillus thermosulfidooxidans]|uniref:serine hydrolase n=1 Tax=Sulfobacillus thermosulfidooxidans TaxID=28034 RepID=UPI0006B5D12C|nr:serine hydrolase [Sulfobacillus thermosulfidooxidans]